MVTLTVFGFLFTVAASVAGLLVMIGDGPRYVVVVPVLVAAVPALVARTRHVWTARLAALFVGLALLAFVLVAGFSVGLFYAPAALTMLVAVFAPPPLPEPTSLGLTPRDDGFWNQRGGVE